MNPEVPSKVKTFIEAYEQWFKVHQDIDEAGSSGNVVAQDNEKLLVEIHDRDKVREELIAGLDKF